MPGLFVGAGLCRAMVASGEVPSPDKSGSHSIPAPWAGNLLARRGVPRRPLQHGCHPGVTLPQHSLRSLCGCRFHPISRRRPRRCAS